MALHKIPTSIRQMKNTRTGKIAVYDADLIETGRWEKYVSEDSRLAPRGKTFKATASIAVESAATHAGSTTE